MQARFTVAVTTLRRAVEGKLARQRQAGVATQQPGEGARHATDAGIQHAHAADGAAIMQSALRKDMRGSRRHALGEQARLQFVKIRKTPRRLVGK